MLAVRAGDAAEVARLAKAGAAIDSRSKGRWTPLMYAVEKRHAEVVELLLRLGANPRARGREGTSAVNSAFGDLALMEALIRAGAEVNDPKEDLLVNAAFVGQPAMIRMLIKLGADVNGCSHDRPLSSATERGHGYGDPHASEVVALLLNAGARAKLDDLTHALYIERTDDPKPMTELLLQAGVDVNASNSSHWTPLHWAAINGDAKGVARLLKAGGNLEAEDDFHRTPLDLAVEKGAGEVVTLLLAQGASVRGTEQRSPVAAAAERGYAEITRQLLKAGATPGLKASRDLLQAARRLNLPEVQLLLEAGADPNYQQDGSGWTPLALALGDPQVVSPKGGWADPETLREPTLKLTRIFLALPGDTQASKNAALLHAAKRQPLEIIRLLVEAGADPATSSVNFSSVRENARSNPDRRVAEYLRESR